MNNQGILSGYDIVSKGATKIEATLPDLGIKDVFPSKTWLENKQIQAAIEARKHLIEVERIDKSGVLSHAEWREELMLAEVTQKVGSYWQYLGHSVGQKLYLKPEEALFLLESNSLCLKHNDIKVSLQQAYNLLLQDKITHLQYKVYASLSRIGYRVYRHTTNEANTCVQKINDQNIQNNSEIVVKREVNVLENAKFDINNEKRIDCSNRNTAKILHEHSIKIKEETENEDTSNNLNTQQRYTKSTYIKDKKVCSLKKLETLKNRQLKPCKAAVIHNYFDNLPELTQRNTVVIKVPDKNLIPNTINLTKVIFNVNLLNVQKKEIGARPSSTESNIYSANDEVNGSHIRRLRNISNRTESNSGTPPATNRRFATQNPHYRPFIYSRPPLFVNFNMLFQRPFLPGCWFAPNLNFMPRVQPYPCHLNFNNRYNNRKRSRKNSKKQHLDGIFKLATTLKRLILAGNINQENIYALQRLIQTYNTRYETKLRLNETFEVVIDERIVDTITLDDDDDVGNDDDGEPSSKRRKSDPTFEENLNNLKIFGMRLKELDYKNKSSGKHRRAFSKLLKTFNASYNEDYYLKEDYELACRNQIQLDSSNSDLDCIIDETPNTSGSKKLKNPFNILKRLSETQKPTDGIPNSNSNLVTTTSNKYNEITLKTFSNNWLPGVEDFGRAEIITKDNHSNEVMDVRREEFLYDFIKIQTCQFDNWLDLKKSFFSSIQAAITEFQDNMPTTSNLEVNSIVKPEDCTDIASVLKKLRIIKCNKGTKDQCNLVIDFDVYNRDVQNFRKSNRPTPHFRLICISETTNMPPGVDVATLHSKYFDEVPIVFAIVGIDSISYVQVNPIDLPVYISGN